MSGGLLQCSAICGGYGISEVLFGIDCSIGAGEVVGLLGRNGMGKSTTIKHLVGVLRPRRGEVVFDGQRIDGKAANEIARLGI